MTRYSRSIEAQAYHHLYTTTAWRKLRIAVLEAEPLCEYCLWFGRTSEATLVDHIEPHRGDEVLFWDRDNLASSCAPCHSSFKQRLENGSTNTLAFDEGGYPIEFDIAAFRQRRAAQ